MKPILIEPTDTFFFRDSIPMAAGQGKGAGARLPLPSTLHEAIRAGLIEQFGRSDSEISGFRPREAPRTGGWLGKATSLASKGSKDFQSLNLIGPFPVRAPKEKDTQVNWFIPLPLDLVADEKAKLRTLLLLESPAAAHSGELPLLAVSPAPATKETPSGFLDLKEMERYLQGNLENLAVTERSAFFEPEYRVSIAIDPQTSSTAHGQLYAATHARPQDCFRLGAWIGLRKPVAGEEEKLERLDFLLLGGERRLARIHRSGVAEPLLPAAPEILDGDGPVLLKWVLVTPAVFAHGWLPGWCVDTQGARSRHEVCLPLTGGRARLVAACLGKLQAFAGWDTVDHRAKPTQLAVAEGSVYYFLCENPAAAGALAALLHWRPRSDVYGEKGFGFGFVSAAVEMHPTSADIRKLAQEIFSF